MKTSTKITLGLAAFAIFALSMGGMYLLGNINGKVKVKTQLTINEGAVYETAKLATFEEVGTCTFTYSNRVSEEGGLLAQLKGITQNFLTERTVTITGPYIASYGVELDTNFSYVEPNLSKDEIFITLPEPELIFYQTPNDSSQRKIIEDNGVLVLERNSVIEDMESRWYMQGKSAAIGKEDNISGAKEKIAKVFETLYGKTLGKKVFVKFEKDFKGYTKIPSQKM